MSAFDIDFYRGSKNTLIAEITDASRKPYSYIVTPNVNHIVQLEHDQDLKRAYASASQGLRADTGMGWRVLGGTRNGRALSEGGRSRLPPCRVSLLAFAAYVMGV